MRMKTWLQKHAPKSRFDWAWIRQDACWRPIKSYRTITRGKKKGWLEVELLYPEGRKRKIPAGHFRPKEVEQI